MRLLAAVFLFASLGAAHVGVKDVFFEGLAGPYPLNVVIRPPSVIPGVAEISIRAASQDVQRIHLSTMALTGAGAKFPPTPDLALRSAQDPLNFTGSCWLMVSGSWQVRLVVDGARGQGVLSIPVAALSERVTPMDSVTGAILTGLVALLVLGVIGIAGAAFGQATLPPGQQPRPGRRAAIRAVSLVASLAAVWFGLQWWEAEAKAYTSSIYKPLQAQAVQSGNRLILNLAHSGWYQPKSLDDFIDDHGYRMHLFLIRESEPSAFYHLHPVAFSAGRFEFLLPKGIHGKFKVFADLLHRTGLAETVSASTSVSIVSETEIQPPDDSWTELSEKNYERSGARLNNGWQIQWERPARILANTPLQLRFRVLDADGNPAKNLRPFLGMPAHLVLFRRDFGVFAHLHPGGTASMGAAALALGPQDLLDPDVAGHGAGSGRAVEPEFSFPFGFPGPGNYRMILQFRDFKEIHSVPFDLSVL